ncbi:lytic transglycosylase domain-containing protein [Aureimonas sp. AU4]|uniref:lytic transglycosylase domain-containing protein n=1 Tax=Aureimonas sp. AU4 TaxID=1638163 RepID=UPI00178CE2D5|nr:lytic transglycosylase domain-containing protein [Aureimonas sp. AU4]
MVHRLAVALALMLAAASCLPARAEETSRSVVCGIVDRAATAHALPSSFLTRLIWRESSFRTEVRSRVGAQGIAQFMPSTARERGLADPFDPEAAIPASAAYLSELRTRFGSLDLAAAAYNAGPGRVARWLDSEDALPDETIAHVRFITGGMLDRRPGTAPTPGGREEDTRDCLTTLASIARVPGPGGEVLARVIAPWGVQLIAGPNKEQALRQYRALQVRFGRVLADQQPTILTTRLGGRGQRSYYRIRVAFDQRSQADGLCRRLRQAGGSCLSTRN